MDATLGVSTTLCNGEIRMKKGREHEYAIEKIKAKYW